jgi:hypothetical protein
VGRQDSHADRGHQPQQSVLNPQAGQRQTACIRYISAPQRSQSVFSSPRADAVVVFSGETMRGTGRLSVPSDTRRIIAQRVSA